MIKETTILTQLWNLIEKKAIEEILIDGTVFFSNYKIEDHQKSLERDQLIFNLHEKYTRTS